jgi:uncharacterized protein YndB with AHSA1/START domain
MHTETAKEQTNVTDNHLTLSPQGDRDIEFARTFEAPRTLVFRAMTTPELLKRWLLGPPGWSMVACDIDLKVGGEFHYAWRNVAGQKLSMRGIFREVVSPERTVSTEWFEGCAPQSGKQLATSRLVEDKGKTLLRCTIVYPSREARDATLASGMKEGLGASYDRLADLLTTL